jgi:sugar lactone lactonase YvrE
MHFITPIHFFRSIFFILLFSQGGESVCPIGSQSVYFNSSCQPTTPGPIDTVFYLSGSINEGVTAFSTIINVSNSLTYWTSDNPTVVPGIALVSRSGGKLISNDTLLQSMLPIGSNPFSISTWIKCDVINRLESPYGSLFFWGKGYASYALTSLNMYISSVDVSSSNLVIVTTLAGRGGPSGPTSVLTNGIGTSATFASPTGVAVDSSFNVFIGDSDHQCIRKITSKGVVTTFAGSGVQGFADGVSTLANFFSPIGVAVDTLGYVYVADTFNNRIRKINQNGDVSTLAGEVSGYVDGTGTSASFKEPWGITVDTVGNIYVADTGNSRIRKITSSGIVTTLAGTGQEAYADGVGTLASFYGPTSLSVDLSGENIYVADVNNFCIRKVSSSTGTVSTLAGRGPNLSIRDGTGSNAVFEAPYSVTVDGSGNIYVTDSDPSILRHTIRKITPSAVVTTIAGRAETGYKDGFGTSAVFTDPTGIAVDNYGNLYATDFGDNRVRKIIFHPRPFPVCDGITWRHIALTFSGSPTNSMKTFIDGASFTSSNVVFEINSNDSTLEIFSSGLPAMTAISDLRIFNRAVSSAEVTNLSYVPPIQCLAGFYFSSGSCLPCPSGTFSAFGATSCSCLLCGGAGSVLDKLSENVTSIDNAVEALTQVSAVVDQLASFSNSSGVGGSSSSNANATALKTEIISLIGTITGVFSNSASSYLSRPSSNSTSNLTSLLNDTTILIPAAVSELLATNLVSLTSNPAQLTQASASSALDALSDILTLNLPLNVLSGAVDAEGGVRNNSGVAPFPISTATSFLSAINNVLNKFQEDIVRVDESNSKNGTKAASNALNQIDGTLNRLSAAVLRSSNAGSPAVSIVSAPSSATFNSSSTTISGFCGDALSLTAMRVAMPSNSSSNASSSTAALNLPLEKPLSPCLAQGATVAKQQAVTPAVSANGAFLRTAKTASGALTGSVDASFVQYGESPVPQSLGWASMGGANNKVIDSSSSLDTRVVSFKLLSQSGQKLEISGAASPMTLSIPFINPLANSSSSSVVSSYSRLSFNITCPGKSGLLIDDISTNAVSFLQALKSSSTVTKTSSKLTIVSHNKVTGQALLSVPCGNPIGIRNITCRGSNTSYTLSYDCPSISLQPVCAFWNETLNAWSSSGCVVAKVDRDSISCSCNHTTNFAARFVALADQQEDLFSFDSLSALGDTEALFRMYPHVFIIIGVITGIVLVSGFITYELDVFASKRFYETLRNDPEVQFLERIETLKGNVFILDRVMDRKVYDMQDKILRARLQSQAKEIAEAEGLYYIGPREEIPSDIDVNKFDWAPKKQPTFFFDFFSSCFSSSVSDTKANKDLDAEKRLQAPVMQTNPLQRKNMSTPGDATTVAIRQPPPVSNQGCLYRLTHRYTKAIYSKIKGSFETSKISATSKLSVISKTAGVSKSVVEAVKPSSEFDHLESMGEIENENVDGILEELQNATSCRRFMKLRSFLIRTWVLFVLFNHPYLSIFSKYDPRNPRYMRMLKLLVVLIGNLWATTFLYSFVNLEESAAPPVDDSFNMQGDDMQGVDMPPSMEEGEETPKTIPEVILIALMSCLLQVPISLLTTFFYSKCKRCRV